MGATFASVEANLRKHPHHDLSVLATDASILAYSIKTYYE